MKKLTKRWQMLVYSCAAFGVNLLNTIMGSYLCSALIADGFGAEAIANQTFAQINLVALGAWAVLSLIAKIVDGIIDIPLASFTDNLRTKWGRRRPAILIGLIPTMISFALFLIVPVNQAYSIGNTIYYFIMLCLFYSSYTLTMTTYYSTFTEIVDTQKDRNFMSNVKSVVDILYFILGFVLVPIMLKGLNIQIVALCLLPLALTMLIPIFMIKEPSTLKGAQVKEGEMAPAKSVNLFKSIAYTFKNKHFVIWMLVYTLLTFSSQLFLGGINEYFSVTDMPMMLVMPFALGPVPLTMLLFNKIQRKYGFGWGIRYTLLCFGLGMGGMFLVGSLVPAGIWRNVCGAVCGLICSFGIGSMFSVAYSVPSELAAQEQKKTGIGNSAMYFAVQGLFSAVATGLGSGTVLTLLKGANASAYMTLIACAAAVAGALLAFALPTLVQVMGMSKDRKIAYMKKRAQDAAAEVEYVVADEAQREQEQLAQQQLENKEVVEPQTEINTTEE